MKPELPASALHLPHRFGRILWGERCQTGETVRVATDHVGEPIVAKVAMAVADTEGGLTADGTIGEDGAAKEAASMP